MVRVANELRNQGAPIILFDIDWTLLNGINNTHRESFKYAFKHCFDLDSADVFDINPHGLTDTEIVEQVAKHYGIQPAIIKNKFHQALKLMNTYYNKRFFIEKPKILPGVQNLLNSLQVSNFNLGILSGNLSTIGKLKLTTANIEQYFNLFCFPDTTGNKVDSVLQLQSEGITNLIVIIGDTPNDVLSAHSTNSKSIAVATGSYTLEDLLRMSPDLAVKTLEDNSVIDYLSSL